MWSIFQKLYEKQISEHAHWLVVAVCLALVFFGYQARHFTLDASAESLLLENDQSLAQFREVSERYGSHEFLVLTFTPKAPLFSDTSLDILTRMRDEIRTIDQVESVISVMDVPLLSNPPVPMSELVSNIKTLEDPDVDVELARTELANSPLYVNLLLNLAENTTALQINFPIDKTKVNLLAMRGDLRNQLDQSPNPGIESQLELIDELIIQHNAKASELLHQNIEAVRGIMNEYQSYGELHLGGVPMIADDIIGFVRKDLMVFGVAVLVVIIATLAVIFRQRRWVILPLVCSVAVVIVMAGLLGVLKWPVTVISSNFISLLLILTLSMNIHLVVRYRELLRLNPEWNQRWLVMSTVRQIVVPCVYMTLTTGVAFISLISSGIRPVINFGWIMTFGIVVAFLMTFVLLPALLMILGKNKDIGDGGDSGWVTHQLARFTLRNGRLILVSSLAVAVFTIIGVSKLIVENSFIDYFDEQTEIYQGMTVIDQRLGGTTPLEVIVSFDKNDEQSDSASAAEVSTVSDNNRTDSFEVDDFIEEDFAADDSFIDDDFLSMEDEDIGSFEDDFVGEDDPNKYWFTTDKVADIKKIHKYLDQLPETGKVISLATMMEIAEEFNDGKPLSNIQLALLYTVIPEEFRAIVLDPYVSVEHNEARINVRILDSMKGLQRDKLLKNIRHGLVELGFEPDQVHLTGMLVLYNNMLQSLFSSQILTLGGVFIGIMLMFLILFRNLKLALIAMVPNLLAATLVLGVMGWFGIPLDIMTITIASITIGIAVDNTIHYIVRYRVEFLRDQNYSKTLRRSHASIGRAIFYTSITIIMGFSILSLSNFKPTIYFGLLTALAMAIALLGALTLLPRLILWSKPFGRP
jgi:uncharacterized protein